MRVFMLTEDQLSTLCQNCGREFQPLVAVDAFQDELCLDCLEQARRQMLEPVDAES